VGVVSEVEVGDPASRVSRRIASIALYQTVRISNGVTEKKGTGQSACGMGIYR
jgi:hypothetical protein